MGVDFFLWVSGQITKGLVMHKLTESQRSLNSKLRDVVTDWCKSLPYTEYVDPESVLSVVVDADSECNHPCRDALREKLAKCELPHLSEWSDALVEHWRCKKKTLGDEANALFRADSEDADAHLQVLAKQIHIECTKHVDLFRPAVVGGLHEIGERLEALTPERVASEVAKILQLQGQRTTEVETQLHAATGTSDSVLAGGLSAAFGDEGSAEDLRQALILLDAGRVCEAKRIIIEKLERRLSDSVLTVLDRALVTSSLGYLNLGDRPTEAEEAFRKAVGLNPEDTESWNQLGLLLHRQAKYEQARDCFDKIADHGRSRGDVWLVAVSKINLALVHVAVGRYDEAQKLVKSVLQDVPRGKGDLMVARGHGILGNIEWQTGNTAAAEKEYLRARDLFEDADDSMGYSIAVGNLANVYMRQGKYESALKLYRRSLRRDEGSDDLLGTAAGLHNMGNVYLSLGDVDSALECFEKSLRIEEGQRHVAGVVSDLGSIGLVRKMKGQLLDAEVCFRDSLRIAELIGDFDLITVSLCNLGSLLIAVGGVDEARDCFNRAVALGEDRGIRGAVASGQSGLGQLALDQGNVEEALERFSKSEKIFKEMQETHSVAAVLLDIGNASVAKNDLKHAETCFRRSLDIANRLGHLVGKVSALCSLATISRKEGKTDEAVTSHKKALELVSGEGLVNLEATIRSGLGLCLIEAGQLEEARAELSAAIKELKAVGELYTLTSCVGNLGLLDMNQGLLDSAKRHFVESLELSRKTKDIVGEANSLANLGKLEIRSGNRSAGVERLMQARAMFSKAGREELVQKIERELSAIGFSV